MFGRKKKITRRRRTPEVEQVKSQKAEIPRKWGKKERYLVGILLVSSMLVSLLLALSARDGKLPGLPRIVSPEISLKDTIVVENKDYIAKDTRNREKPIIESWLQATDKLSGIYGLYVVRLNDQTSYGLHFSEQYTAASLIKLPVLIALYREAERGFINLESQYTLSNSDKTGGSGGLQYKEAGTKYTYRKLAEAMGQQSDNTAFTVVVNKLGVDKIKQTIIDLGMRNTDFDNNLTTPEDIATLYKKLWQGQLVSVKSRDEILTFLTKTIYESHLAAGIPTEVSVAHKYGRELHVVNDAGIVYTEKPFIVVIMSKGIVESEADSIFPVLSKIVYDGETS